MRRDGLRSTASSEPELREAQRLAARRSLLRNVGLGLGSIALGTLLERTSVERTARADQPVDASELGRPGLAGLPHFPPKARRVIWLFMSGGPSQIDLFDDKPSIRELHGTPLPDHVRGGQRLTGMTSGQKEFPICGPIVPFARHGECGRSISSLLPATARVVDRLAFVKSLHTEAINHDPGITLINTGSQIPGRPSLGAWAGYGLGSENENMPAYVVLVSQGTGKNPGQPIFSRLWGSGFLPSSHQGVQLRSSGDPVLYLADPPGIDRAARRDWLDDLGAMNRRRLETVGDPEIESRIAQYEMAFRMQAEVPSLVDLSDEPESTFERYGDDAKIPGTFAYNCLLARRMAESNVRFIQLFHRGWDQHSDLPEHLAAQCRDTDRASAALVEDLAERGLLDDTLVVWGGEFGRTSYSQGALGTGRDHHGRCFTVWLAGGGVRGGIEYGASDDWCYNVAEDPVHIRDLNRTILHCLGIDSERFTFRFQGLDFNPVGVEPARVVHEILA
ncbi:MAG TPA: sulfatase [Planctomycetaceae bacterium]|nr:sulfatase [Planctomycetaceae bacterium]HRF01308.1 DUF1501 domain-containing protein [Pirellulaceae bacterium]